MIGASGTISSSTNNGNLGQLTLTVKWRQEFNPGDTKSTVYISAAIQRAYGGAAAGGTWTSGGDGSISVNGAAACGWSKGQTAAWGNAGSIGWNGSGSVKVEHTDAVEITVTWPSNKWTNGTYSGSSFTMPGNTKTITLQPVPQLRTLTIDAATGSWIRVERDGEELTGGDALYDGDVLTITAGANAGYALTGLTVNGESITSGDTYTVSGNVSVASTAKAQGLAYIGGEKYIPYIGNAQYQPYVGAADGSKWELLS